MRILQISIAFPKNGCGLYKDLALKLKARGHDVSIVAIDANADLKDGRAHAEDGLEVVRVKAGPVFNVGKFRKGITFLKFPFVLKSAIKKNFSTRNFDLILFMAPPVTLYPAVKWAMKHFGCPSYLMQKDIFPQNAVDLGFFGKRSPAYLYFRAMEKNMLKTATKIGCMSRGNIKYLLEHNKFLSPDKLDLFPNTKDALPIPAQNKPEFLKKHNLPPDSCVFLFSGNMGKPQNIPLICEAMKYFSSDKSVSFVAIGSGTESRKLKSFIAENNLENSAFIEALPREEYEKLAASCDVGIVSLDPRFTIPNYPSKTLSYMESAQPIVAVTDTATDYKDLIQSEANCGLWSDANHPQKFFENIKKLSSDENLRKTLGANGRRYMIEHFNLDKSVEIIEKNFQK